jgi:hypothetical protein
MRNVLVFTPILRLEPETEKAIFSLEWDGVLSVLFQRDNPVDLPPGLLPTYTHDIPEERLVGIQNHLHQFQRGREIFLASQAEAMLVIESDIIPPPDTLKRLAALECDVAYGCYMFRSGNPVVNVLERYYPWPAHANNIGESLTIRGLWQDALAKGVVECSGSGFGCVLIRRHVLEAVPIRLETGTVHCDTYWTMDVHRRGYKMLADTKVRCGHKTPDGRVLWPPT